MFFKCQFIILRGQKYDPQQDYFELYKCPILQWKHTRSEHSSFCWYYFVFYCARIISRRGGGLQRMAQRFVFQLNFLLTKCLKMYELLV